MIEFPHISKGRSKPFLDITNLMIKKYIRDLRNYNDPVFQNVEKFAKEINYPIIDYVTGHLISVLVNLGRHKNIFEMGSGFGYSALWFAKGMSGNGKITLTDIYCDYLTMAKSNLSKQYPLLTINTFCGDTIQTLEQSEENYDCIFIDIGDKSLYPKAGKIALEKTSVNGMIIADNVLWRGKVVESEPDKQTKSINIFNEQMMAVDNFDTIILPVGDGLLVSIKKY